MFFALLRGFSCIYTQSNEFWWNKKKPQKSSLNSSKARQKFDARCHETWNNKWIAFRSSPRNLIRSYRVKTFINSISTLFFFLPRNEKSETFAPRWEPTFYTVHMYKCREVRTLTNIFRCARVSFERIHTRFEINLNDACKGKSLKP